jgi:dTMP kinase
MFITFEGVEGCGKTVQIERARAYLESLGCRCVLTREPGGTPFGVAVRQVLLKSGGPRREALSELLLYLADRHQHLKEKIEPELARGQWVLSDRYHDATRAYQGAARGVPLATIDELARICGIREPDATVLLDLDVETALSRAWQRNVESIEASDEGRFEEEAVEFHRAVRAAYLNLAQRWPARIRVIPGAGTPDEVFERIRPLLDECVARRTVR